MHAVLPSACIGPYDSACSCWIAASCVATIIHAGAMQPTGSHAAPTCRLVSQEAMRGMRQQRHAAEVGLLQQGLPAPHAPPDDVHRALGAVGALSRHTDALLLFAKAVHGSAWLQTRACRRWPVRTLSYL